LRHFAHFAVKISERCSGSGGANMVFAVRLLQGRQRNYEESLGALVPEGGVVTRRVWLYIYIYIYIYIKSKK
jgi:hypothetical protein